MSHRNQIKSAQLLRHQATLLPTNVSVMIGTFIRQPAPRADMRKLKRIVLRLAHQVGTISLSCPSGFPAFVPQEKFFTDPVGSLRTVIVEYCP